MVPVLPVVALSLLIVVPGAAIRRVWRRRAGRANAFPVEILGVAEPAMQEVSEPVLPWPNGLVVGDRVDAARIAAELHIEPRPGWHKDAERIVAVLADTGQLRVVKGDQRFYFNDESDKAAAELAARAGEAIPLFLQDEDRWRFAGFQQFQKPAVKSVRCVLVS